MEDQDSPIEIQEQDLTPPLIEATMTEPFHSPPSPTATNPPSSPTKIHNPAIARPASSAKVSSTMVSEKNTSPYQKKKAVEPPSRFSAPSQGTATPRPQQHIPHSPPVVNSPFAYPPQEPGVFTEPHNMGLPSGIYPPHFQGNPANFQQAQGNPANFQQAPYVHYPQQQLLNPPPTPGLPQQNLFPPQMNPGANPFSFNNGTNPGVPNPSLPQTVHMNSSGNVRHFTTRPSTSSVSIIPTPQGGSPDFSKGYRESSGQMNSFPHQRPGLTFDLGQVLFLVIGVISLLLGAFFVGRWTFQKSDSSSKEKLVEISSSNPLDFSQKKYTIRVSSLQRTPNEVGRYNLTRCVEIKEKLFHAGYKEVFIRGEGDQIVVEVGSFPSPQGEAILLNVQKLKQFMINQSKAFKNVCVVELVQK